MAVAALAALKSPLWGLVTGVAATTVDIKTS
jgi:hypothetical protein